MGANNEFRFIGVCYRDAEKVFYPYQTLEDGSPKYYTNIVLVVKSSVGNPKKNYIPIIACGDLAEKASLVCRNGYKVAICGEITTKEYFNRVNGDFKITTSFIANDIMLITSVKRKSLRTGKYKFDIESASIDEYVVPKKRK